jgi:hypothetical protein
VGGVTLSVPQLDAYTAHVDGGFVAVVEVAPDRYRRRVFMTLKAAENHVRRARERGQSARIVLATLTPLYIVEGTAQAPLGDLKAYAADHNNKAGPGSVGSTAGALTPSSDPSREGLA